MSQFAKTPINKKKCQKVERHDKCYVVLGYTMIPKIHNKGEQTNKCYE